MFIRKENGGWIHKTKLKVCINPILRKLQFWTNKPFVIASQCVFTENEPKFLHYTFARIKYK